MSYVISNPELFRKNVRNQLYLLFESVEDNERRGKCATNLEIGVYNYAIREATLKKIVKSWQNISFSQLYIDHLRSIYFNLRPPLIQQIVDQTVKPQEIAFMTHQEFDASQWKELIDKKTKRDDSKLTTNVESSTSLFTCKKCYSKKCTYYELQIRSADEPATLFITCLDCGKHWKM
jgi:transcription elongation factor S-II